VDEQVQRVNALLEAAFEAGPFGARNNARHEIEWERFFNAGAFAIDVEGDAHLNQGPISRQLARHQFFVGQGREIAREMPRGGPRLPVLAKHLVKARVQLVAIKLHEHSTVRSVQATAAPIAPNELNY